MKFNVEKSITIKASKKKVKDLILNFKQWNKWSPWTIADPDTKMTYKGKAGEIGHTMSWDSDVIGKGNNTLTKVSDNRIDYDLEFLTPYKSKSKVHFTLKSSGKSTTVTWFMEGSMPFFMFFMIPMMRNWVGMDYERGLKMLKALAEDGKIKAKTTNKGVVDLEGFSYVGLQRTVAMSDTKEVMQKDFEKLIADIVVKHGKSAKHWMTLYPKMNMRTMEMTYIAAVSDEELGNVDLGSEYVRGEIKSGKALEIFHKGAYDFIGNAWSMGMMHLRANKTKQGGVQFEHYWNSPKEVAPEKLETSVYFPLK